MALRIVFAASRVMCCIGKREARGCRRETPVSRCHRRYTFFCRQHSESFVAEKVEALSSRLALTGSEASLLCCAEVLFVGMSVGIYRIDLDVLDQLLCCMLEWFEAEGSMGANLSFMLLSDS